jgi:cellulose synthase operon protein C
LLSKTGREDAAIVEYAAAAKLEPEIATPYVRIAMIRQKKGETELAQESYRRALAIEPTQVIALNNLAWIDLQLSASLDEALTLAKKAVEEAPNVGQFLDTLGWVYHARGEKEQAISTLKRGTTMASQDPEIWYHLGVVFEEAGKNEDALAAFNKSLSFKKDFPEASDTRKRAEKLSKRVH